jgi:hypothetical protein
MFTEQTSEGSELLPHPWPRSSALVAGYLLAGWWFGAQDTTPLRQICARVDYLNSLQEALPEQRAPTEEMRNQFTMLVAQCREALGNPIEENE